MNPLLLKVNERTYDMLVNYIRTALALKMDKKAVTAIEYALIASLIAVVIIGSLTSVGKGLNDTLTKVSAEL